MNKLYHFSFSVALFVIVVFTFCFTDFGYSQASGTLYGSTGNMGATLITIDPVTGAGTSIAPHGAFGPVTEIEFRNDGVLFGSTGQGTSNIITIDPLTGNESLIGTHPFGMTAGLEFNSGNILLGSFFNPGVSTDLVIIDQSTGLFTTTIGVIGTMVITGLTFHANGTLYGAGHNAMGVFPSELYTIDPATGVSTLIGPIGFDNVGALEFGPNGILYGGVGSPLGGGGPPAGDLITIDPATGVGTSVGPTGFPGISGLSFVPEIIPVELTSFTATVNNEGSVVLNWSTATEVNNHMFEIERENTEGQFNKIGFVEGHGTTAEQQEYSYVDNSVKTGTYYYRLKQIDFSGQYEYSNEIEIEVNGPLTFGLEQNYPNPFNPSTLIKYSVPENGFVKLSIYNLVGEEVNVLVSKTVDAGFYEVTFNATNLPSGTYFYRLQTGNTVQAKKMVLMK